MIAATPGAERLRQLGFTFLRAPATRQWLQGCGKLDDWAAFAASWNDMPLDEYMADGGRYRRRRHAVFAARRGEAAITRQPHQPHFQATDHNPLNGGIDRWFEPVAAAVASGASLRTILAACRGLFDSLTPAAAWQIEIHQFRIEAGPGQVGQPTPEGLHRDGVDWVLVLMIGRHNIASGTTTIHGSDKAELGSFTLTEPLDAAMVDDNRVMHGVTAIHPIDPDRPAHRDVLVVTFKRVG
jgi:hypothetical protein